MADSTKSTASEAKFNTMADDTESRRAPNARPGADAAAEVDQLHEENARLRAELAHVKRKAAGAANTRPDPVEPSYGISEGQRDELERNGRTTSPFTGARQVGSGADDVREATKDEFDEAGE